MTTLRIHEGGDLEATHENVHFHLYENDASWSSEDFEETGRIQDAQVSLVGPGLDGRMSLKVAGWAALTRLDPGMWQEWYITL